MTRVYCTHHHADPAGAELCAECAQLIQYARRRLEKCPYGPSKPTSARCPIHCYKPGQRARARMIMRYSGPRMLFKHPYLAIAHKLDGFRKVEHPRELTREQRAKLRQS